MKRFILAATALALVASAQSFARADYNQSCEFCRGGHHGHRHAQACPPNAGPFANFLNSLGLGRNSGMYQAAPPAPTVGYPYYTVRAPRDFLDPNPRSIGP